MINLYQLQMFLAVVDTGSFSAAAAQLHLTQPAVSEGLRALEQRLGTQLFERRGHRAILTPEGVALIEPARTLLGQAEQAEQDILRQRGILRGTLRLVTATSAAAPWLAARLGAFVRVHTGVRCTLVVREPAAVLEGLRAGEWEAGFLGEQPRGNRLTILLVAQDEWVLVVPPGHGWHGAAAMDADGAGPPKPRRGRPPTRRPAPLAPRPLVARPLADLRDQPLVLESADSVLGALARRELRDLLEEHGLPWNAVQPVCELGSPLQALRAVEAGAGVGLLPRSILEGYAGPARAFQAADGPLVRPLYAVRDSRVPPSPLTTAWWAFLSTAGPAGP